MCSFLFSWKRKPDTVWESFSWWLLFKVLFYEMYDLFTKHVLIPDALKMRHFLYFWQWFHTFNFILCSDLFLSSLKYNQWSDAAAGCGFKNCIPFPFLGSEVAEDLLFPAPVHRRSSLLVTVGGDFLFGLSSGGTQTQATFYERVWNTSVVIIRNLQYKQMWLLLAHTLVNVLLNIHLLFC